MECVNIVEVDKEDDVCEFIGLYLSINDLFIHSPRYSTTLIDYSWAPGHKNE